MSQFDSEYFITNGGNDVGSFHDFNPLSEINRAVLGIANNVPFDQNPSHLNLGGTHILKGLIATAKAPVHGDSGDGHPLFRVA